MTELEIMLNKAEVALIKIEAFKEAGREDLAEPLIKEGKALMNQIFSYISNF